MAILLIKSWRQPHKGILQEPDPILRKSSNKVKVINNTTLKIAQDLIEKLKIVDRPHIPWLGMAAPQIGYNERIIAIKKTYNQYVTMINPEIVDQKFLLPTISGCFSLRGLYLTKSHYWLRIKYQDLNGEFHTELYLGGEAVLMQQELDHLDGKLVCD